MPSRIRAIPRPQNNRSYSFALTGNAIIDTGIYLIGGIGTITGILIYAVTSNYTGINWLFVAFAIVIFSSFCILPGIKIALFNFFNVTFSLSNFRFNHLSEREMEEYRNRYQSQFKVLVLRILY